MFLFHLPVLFQQRLVLLLNLLGKRLFFRCLSLNFRFRLGCRSRLYGVRRRWLDTVGIIQFQIQAQAQRVIERITQITGYAVNTSLVLIDDSRFAEWVRANLRIRAYHILRKRHQIFVARHLGAMVNNRLDEKFLVSRQRFLAGMFLQNDKVRPCIGSGIVAKRIVRQTQCRHKVGTFHKFHSYKRRSSVHHTLRGDKGNESSLTHLVECFEEEIIVYRLCRLSVGNLLAHGIRRVGNRKISERNI